VKRHELDGVSLVFGWIFLGVAILWALVAGQAMGGDGLRVGGPVLLIVAGLAGVLSSLGAGRRRRKRPAPGAKDTGAEDTGGQEI
jgi:hypothetical protein